MASGSRHEEDLSEKAKQALLPRFLHHAYSIYLFTASDNITMILTETLFAVFTVLSGSLLTTNPSPHLLPTLSRLPQILLWIWLNLLVFCIANQRRPDSIAEDAFNKPWRPLPSHRLSGTQARHILMVAIHCTWAASLTLGGERETLLLFGGSWMYNDLGAANDHHLVRNLQNALGFIVFGAGAARVACAPGHTLSSDSWQWFLLIGLVVLTTIHTQDFQDRQGDAARGRKTIPLVLGDGLSRWTVAVAVLAWSVAAPAFWGVRWTGFLLTVGLGSLVAIRVMLVRTVQGDRRTFRSWALWLISLYMLPFMGSLNRFQVVL